MCGIVAGVGKIDFRSYLLSGLKKLDYRGYDSAGLAYEKDGAVKLYKILGQVSALERIVPPFEGASLGIAHTRWATHGEPNTVNAHPQKSMHGEFYLVHNGVIENFQALKTKLLSAGYVFASQTDTEVIADLLELNYRECGDVLEAIQTTISQLVGSFACAIIHKGDGSHLYFMKNSSPLLIGVGQGASYLASDAVPMIGFTERFVDLDDGEYGCLGAEDFSLYLADRKIEPAFVTREVDQFTRDLCGYPHYMLKEIEESPAVITRLIDNYFDGRKFLFNEKMLAAIRASDDVVFLGCGTSYYAARLAQSYIHCLGKRSEVYIASEWAYAPEIFAKKPIYVLFSQSGETADLILCQKIINKAGAINIAVCNTKGSSIERNATYSCLVYAGLEVAVASTKSYVAQAALMALLVGALGEKPGAVVKLDGLVGSIKDIIARREEIHALAKGLVSAHDAFYVGRGLDYLACLESSLKLKEVSYVHCEAYPGGELKHGPIALISDDIPVIGFISDPLLAGHIRNNLVELASRRAKVIVVASEALAEKGDDFLIKPVAGCLMPIAEVVFGQYLSYYVSLEKGLPIDKPRNLAKSVTVE